jgi:hypothetical protein
MKQPACESGMVDRGGSNGKVGGDHDYAATHASAIARVCPALLEWLDGRTYEHDEERDISRYPSA